jgi:hypothetical protein
VGGTAPLILKPWRWVVSGHLYILAAFVTRNIIPGMLGLLGLGAGLDILEKREAVSSSTLSNVFIKAAGEGEMGISLIFRLFVLH